MIFYKSLQLASSNCPLGFRLNSSLFFRAAGLLIDSEDSAIALLLCVHWAAAYFALIINASKYNSTPVLRTKWDYVAVSCKIFSLGWIFTIALRNVTNIERRVISFNIITARKQSLRRLCFYTCLSFCPQSGGVSAPGMGGCLLPGGCLVETPHDGYCCGRYASYWNAFLFIQLSIRMLFLFIPFTDKQGLFILFNDTIIEWSLSL